MKAARKAFASVLLPTLLVLQLVAVPYSAALAASPPNQGGEGTQGGFVQAGEMEAENSGEEGGLDTGENGEGQSDENGQDPGGEENTTGGEGPDGEDSGGDSTPADEDGDGSDEDESEGDEAPKTEDGTGTTEPVPENNAMSAGPDAIVDGEEYMDIKDILAALVDNGTLPADTSTSILTGMVLTFKDDKGNAVTNPSLNDFFRLTFTFALPDELTALLTGGGEYYDVTMPDEVKLLNSAGTSWPITNSAGEEVAHLVVTEDGNLRVVFDVDISDKQDVKGGFYIEGQLDENSITEPGDIIISVPDEEDLGTTTVTVRPDIEASVSKDGDFDRVLNPDTITWTVETNRDMNSHNNLTITDTLPVAVTLDGIEVYSFKVDFDGNPIDSSETLLTEGTDYTITYDENGNPVVTFNNEVSYPVRVLYHTTINRDELENYDPNTGGQYTFENSVSVGSEELTDDLTASASVTGTYKSKIEKNVVGYDPETQTMTWEIQYNYNEQDVPAGFDITDLLPDYMIPVEPWQDNFIVRSVTFDSRGNPILGDALVLGEDYEVVYNDADGTYSIRNLKEFDFAVNIQYTTRVRPGVIIDDDILAENYVEDTGGNNDTGTGNIVQQNVVKRVLSVDRENNTINWQVEVNKNRYDLFNWSMTDTLTGAHTFKTDAAPPITVLDVDNNYTLVGSTNPNDTTADYYYSFDNTATPPRLEVVFLNNYLETDSYFIFNYSTVYDPTASDRMVNDAAVHWEEQDGTEHDSDDDAYYTPTSEETHNGKKGGSYNPQTKEITWYVRVNYANTGLVNAYVEDAINQTPPTKQNFVHGSVRIYNYTEDADGNVTRGSELTPAEYARFIIAEPSAANGYTLRIDIPDSDADTLYWFEYRTSLEGEIIGEKTYENVAYFYNDLTDTMELDASASVANGGGYAGKQGFIDGDGVVNWSITVNASQSTLDDVVVTDIHSANQLIDLSELRVYGTTVSSSGRVTVDESNVLTEDADYTLEYTQNADGNWQLVVRFIGTISEPYIIQYPVTVLTGGQNSINLTNDVTVTGNREEVINGGDGGEMNVVAGSGGGWVTEAQETLTLVKRDATLGALVEGIEFQLYFDEAMTRPFGGVITTGTDGEIRIENVPHGTYWLYEDTSTVPDGHSWLNPNPLQVTVNAATGGAPPQAVYNNSSSITITKRDSETNAVIPGTTFALYREATPTDELIGTYTTGANGAITVNTLDEGSYYFTETAASPGYKPGANAQYSFTVTRNAGGQLEVSALTGESGGSVAAGNVVLNEPTLVRFYKLDETGFNGLEGAEFLLEKRSTDTGLWDVYMDGILSDANGMVEIRYLTPGQYRVTEIIAPSEYAKDTIVKFFTIDENNIASDIIGDNFINYPTLVRMRKVDELTGALLAGALFELWWDNPTTGAYERVEERANEIFYSDRNGLLEVGNLQVETQYYFIEIKAPPGYDLDDTPIPFLIQLGSEGVVLELDDFENTPSQVVLFKVDEAGGSLSGATFRLERDYSTAGSPEWSEVDGYGPVTTGEDGTLTISALPVGRYRLIETVAPGGYLLDATPIPFEVVADAEGQLVPVRLDVTNLPTSVTLTKQGPNGELLAGALFQLELQTAGGWQRVRAGETLVTGEDGMLTVLNLVPGRYRFIEAGSPSGYQLNPQPLEFVLEMGETAAISVGPFVDQLTAVQLPKVNANGAPLAGAQFALYQNVGESLWRQVRADENLATGQDGLLTITGLAPGTYRLIETAAPQGYVLNDTPLEFTLAQNSTETLVLPQFVNEAIYTATKHGTQTGDDTPGVWPYVALGAIAVCCIAAVAVVLHRRRKRRK